MARVWLKSSAEPPLKCRGLRLSRRDYPGRNDTGPRHGSCAQSSFASDAACQSIVSPISCSSFLWLPSLQSVNAVRLNFFSSLSFRTVILCFVREFAEGFTL
jgi:hypothetical protein